MMGFSGDNRQERMTESESSQLASADTSLFPWARSEIHGLMSVIYKILKMCLMGTLGFWALAASLCLAPFAAFFILFVVVPAAVFMVVPVMVILAGYQGVQAVRARMLVHAPLKVLTEQQEEPPVARQEDSVPASAPAALVLPEIKEPAAAPSHALVQEEIQVIEPVNHFKQYENHVVDKGKSEIDQGQADIAQGQAEGQAEIDQGEVKEPGTVPAHHVAQEMLVEGTPPQVPVENWEEEKSPKKHSLKEKLFGTKHKKGSHQEVQHLEVIEGGAEGGSEEQVKLVDVVTAPAAESSPRSLKTKFKKFILGTLSSHEPVETESVQSSEGPQISSVSPQYSHDEKTTTEGSSSPTGSEAQGPMSGGMVEVDVPPANQLSKQVGAGAGAGQVPATPSVSPVEGKPASRSGQRAGDAAQQRPSGSKKGGKKKRNGRH